MLAVTRIKEKLLPAIKSCIADRFSSFDEPIFEAMNIIDHHRWDYTNNAYGVSEIKHLASHFVIPLSQHKFNVDAAIYEFRKLKVLVNTRYRHLSCSSSMWEVIATKHSESYGHILLIAELILCMEWASSTVERGFSTCNRLLPDHRLRMRNTRLNALLMLRVNVPVLTSLDPDYETKLVDKAIEKYLTEKKRYHNTTSKASTSKALVSSTSEDLFLPKPCVLSDKPSVLLEDDLYLQISDDEVDDVDEFVTDSDSDQSEEETDYNDSF